MRAITSTRSNPDPPADPPADQPDPPADQNGALDLAALDDRTREQVEELRREAIRARRELRAAQQVSDEHRAELERLRVQQESEQERAIREAVETARTEEAGKWASRLLEAHVTARAAGRLRDPSDAPRHLQLEPLLDQPDERIDEAIAALLEEKPYLALEPGPAVGTGAGAGLVTQGARSGAPSRDAQDPDAWIRGRRTRR